MSNWPDEAGKAFRRTEVRKIQELIDAHRLHASIFEQSMHDLQQTAC
ncbi:hypothetical protein HUU62_04830 [Rhodoferax sp. 4810]|nr:hypothetical protein [Rhodoferax jenense]